tara:strand:- start:15 stop:503 length:489 start_codon:yes stop_codon:yes gene_type:complete
MKINSILLFLMFTKSFSFNNFVKKKTNRIILNSHFSKINTEFKERDILIRSLLEINDHLIYSEIPSLVKGYNGEKVLADIVIKQENGIDIGFALKGDNYEMVTDLQFWDQKLPVEVFLEKISQRYAVNSVIDTCKKEGFMTNSIKNDLKTGCIEIEVSKYNF